jgi:hypothetical protein
VISVQQREPGVAAAAGEDPTASEAAPITAVTAVAVRIRLTFMAIALSVRSMIQWIRHARVAGHPRTGNSKSMPVVP